MRGKKLISALLVFIMIASFVSAGAFAEETQSGLVNVTSEIDAANKVSMLEREIYVSVNGQAFSAFGQTIKCGNGTARLTVDNKDNPVLTLTNATINKTESLGYVDGVNYYAGIVYYADGDEYLTIRTVGKCAITAPAASTKSRQYEGIFTVGNAGVEGDSLVISGFGLGVDCTNGIGSGGIGLTNCTITNCDRCISTSCLFLKGNNKFTASGSYAVNAAGSFDMTVASGRTDIVLTAEGAEDKTALICGGVLEIKKDATLNVTAKMDARNLPSGKDHAVNAVICGGELRSFGKLNATTELVDNGKATAASVIADELWLQNELNASVIIKGAAKAAAALATNSLTIDGGVCSSTIKGAGNEDVALEVQYVNYTSNHFIYAGTDAANPVYGAVVLGEDAVKRIKGNLLIPSDGKYQAMSGQGEAFYIVSDENSSPAKEVLITEQDYPFKDVRSTDYFADPVLWAYENDITNGISTTNFGPNSTCTRAQVVTFLWRAMGCPEVENVDNPFKDVKEDQWYTNAVLWAVANGVTNGTSATTFSPNESVTRSQTVTFLYRAAKGTQVESDNPFNDIQDGKYYYDAVMWAVENGITNGTSQTTFSPNNVCTRGQIVTFLYRFASE